MLIDSLRILFALGLPWLTGALFVIAFRPSRRAGDGPLIAGLGLPLGMVMVVVGYMVLDGLGIGLDFATNALLQGFLALILATLVLIRRRFFAAPGFAVETGKAWKNLGAGGQALVGLLLAVVLVRWLGIAVETVLRPLFPWDAWYAYGLQAKVWFHQQQLDVFANGWGWFQSDGPAWSSGGTRHPPGIGLTQLWLAQALGRWDDALMNLAWPMVLGCIGLGLFGLLRRCGVSLVIAVASVWAIMSLPMVNIQAVLAGYGDPWIAIFVLITGGSALLVVNERRPGWLVVTALAVLGMAVFKEAGLFWLPFVALGLLAGFVRFRWLVVGLILCLGLVVLWLWIQDGPVRISIHGQYGFDEDGIVFPEVVPVWPAVFRHLFVYANWHILWYLAVGVFAAGLWWSRLDRGIRCLTVTVWPGLAALILVSSVALPGGMLDGTSVNRLVLHVVPLIGLLGGLVAQRSVDACRSRATIPRGALA